WPHKHHPTTRSTHSQLTLNSLSAHSQLTLNSLSPTSQFGLISIILPLALLRPQPLSQQQTCPTRTLQKGECEPLEVLNSLSGENIEAEGQPLPTVEAAGDEDRGNESEDEVEYSEDEDGDGGDRESVSDNEAEESTDGEPTADLAVSWLGSPSKNQNILRKVVQSEGLHHLGLKYPGPGRVVDGSVLGTQVCPNSAIISFETGVFYRQRSIQHIGLRSRRTSCTSRFKFNEYLRLHVLEADAGQKTCRHKNCLDAWYPESKIMAEVMMRMESDSKAKLPASKVANIDWECTFQTRDVLQIGLADLEEAKVLDCLTSEGITAPRSSSLSAPLTWPQRAWAKKIRAYCTQDGTLDAKGVVRKLQEAGIFKDTMFLSWASWHFDLVYLRHRLGEKWFQDVLPGNGNMCLLLKEVRGNTKRVVGTTCYRGQRFPLSLPILFLLFLLFLLFFGENHPLSGSNHHALVDAQKLALVAKLYMDLCNPPGKRVYWQESGSRCRACGRGNDLWRSIFLPVQIKRQSFLEMILENVMPIFL
ncbi:Threonyl/alanyl tRNA synthetase SAD, partial [Penicillium sp. CMV-2018d]